MSPQPPLTGLPPPLVSPPTATVLWTGIWFVGFCFLANQWQHSPPKKFLVGSSSAKAAITFTFFCIPIWVRTAPSLARPVGQVRARKFPEIPEWGASPSQVPPSAICPWAVSTQYGRPGRAPAPLPICLAQANLQHTLS